jgi:glycosyltransferase involved in cell wall biosynthesis
VTSFLFIASDYKPKPGGIAAYLDTLARGLIALGHPVHVLGVVPPEDEHRIAFLERYEPWVTPFPVAYDERPKNWLGDRFVAALEILRCSSPTLGRLLNRTPPFRSSAKAVARLSQIVARSRPDVVVLGHLDLYQYPFVLLFRERQLPYGIIAHDVEVHRSPNRQNDLVRRGMMLRDASWIAANSRHTRAEVKAWGIADRKIILIHPPVSEEALKQDPEEKPSGSGGVYTLVTVCRVVRGKGIDIALHALKILMQRGISCRYVIGGDGPEREHLQRLAFDIGVRDRVRFAGSISESDKWLLLRSADVFVMPSRVNTNEQHEGFGIAFVEANACGIPAVGTRTGGIPDAIVDGVTGLLVEAESPESLADALMFLYHRPEERRQMGETGMRRARREFSPTAIATRFQEEVSSRVICG